MPMAQDVDPGTTGDTGALDPGRIGKVGDRSPANSTYVSAGRAERKGLKPSGFHEILRLMLVSAAAGAISAAAALLVVGIRESEASSHQRVDEVDLRAFDVLRAVGVHDEM